MLPELIFYVLGTAAYLTLHMLFGDLGKGWRNSLGQRPRARAWRAAARVLGLKDLSEPMPSSLAGWSGARQVCFEYSGEGNGRGTWLVLAGDSGITLRPETRELRAWKALGNSEIQIGDPAFDDEFYIEGGRTEVLRAVLDVETRAALRELFKGPLQPSRGLGSLSVAVRIVQGELLVQLRDADYVGQPARLVEAVKELLEVAARLDQPPDLAARIAENTRREPEWRVRLENVSLLAEKFPHHAATREALEAARSDPRPEVRLAAALASGEDGPATLLEIASLRSWDEACVARSIALLGKHITPGNAEEVLSHALRSRQLKTIRACLRCLGQAGGPKAIKALAKVLIVEGDELAAAAAEALGASGHPAAEAPLLEALARGRSVDVRVAAAAALGHVGSAAAVLPLKELGARGGADASERRAARQAIAEIPSRLYGASPGQLSLAEEDAGALSLAGDDPAGRVSLAEEGEAK
jgi:HEAT repeat protein